MGTPARRNFLKSICANSPWTYAVFWKLKHQNNMLLTWEDGYYDYAMSRQSLTGRANHGNPSEEVELIFCNQQSSRNPKEFSLGFAIGYLSSLQYALGEGVIGRAALAGHESWVFSDDNYSGESFSSESKFPDEWLQQVKAGIKTILLVPALPYGVLQLGSISEVAENHLWVTEIRERFNSFQSEKEPMQSVFSVDSIVWPPCSKETSNLNVRETSSYWSSQHNRSESEIFEFMATAKITSEELSSSDNLTFEVPDPTPASLRGPSDVTELPRQFCLLDPCLEPLKESNLQFTCFSNDLNESLVDDLFNFACVEEVTRWSFPCYDDNIEYSPFGEIVDSYVAGDTLEEPGTEKDDVFTDHRITEACFDFPVGSELHEALGAAIQIQNGEIPCESYELGEFNDDMHSFRGSHMDLISTYYPSSMEAFGFVNVDDNISHPQPILPGAFESLDDFQLYNCYGINPTVASPLMLSVSASLSSPQCEVKSGWPIKDTAPPQSEPAPFFDTVDISHDSADSDPTTGSGLTTLVEEIKPKKHLLTKSQRDDKRKPSNKKRKVAENAGHKPRPKDRQLIQDRLQELRELIPNGSMCSIDGLLDKAIKHMIFLSSVSEQAEKLTQTVNQEVPLMKKSADIQDHVKGASWTVEMNKDLELSPVVVKDLKRAGYMLIEMLCNEHELFFEIAKVICHLRLTILRGIMKNHSEDTWAQFIIEAPRGFSRMEIFVPLMQLLQLHRKRVRGAT